MTWNLPAEPGPYVTAVKDRGGHLWTREDGAWTFAHTVPADAVTEVTT